MSTSDDGTGLLLVLGVCRPNRETLYMSNITTVSLVPAGAVVMVCDSHGSRLNSFVAGPVGLCGLED